MAIDDDDKCIAYRQTSAHEANQTINEYQTAHSIAKQWGLTQEGLTLTAHCNR